MTQTELRSNIDVVLYALMQQGGDQHKVHTEDIAHEAFILAKERFGWKLPQFREFPDKEPVRSALMDAAKAKYGSLVSGRSGTTAGGKDADGWMFTPAGVRWIRDNQQRIDIALKGVRPQAKPTDAGRFIRMMKDQPLFQRFVDGSKLVVADRYAFTDMLNSSPDAPIKVVKAKFDRLRTQAEAAADPDVKKFLAECACVFASLLGTMDSNGNNKEGE